MRRLAHWVLIAILGSQASFEGLAPSRSEAAPRRPEPWQVRRPAPEALTAGHRETMRLMAERRLARRRAVPDQLGGARRDPWVSGRRPPLLAPDASGRLVRTIAAAGVPDTIRVLGLRVEFDTDSLGSQTSTPDGRFDLRDGEALGILIDPPPHNRSYFMSHLEAVARYWKHQSYGQAVIEYDVYPKAENAAYRLGDTGRYGPWTLGQSAFDEAQRFFRESVLAADAADSIPFGDFDVVAVFHAGADFQSDLLGDSPRDIPTYQIALSDSAAVNGGAVGIHGGLVMPETENQDGFFGAINGTLAHEFGHTQGLPDLYDIYTFFPAVGVWSNMDSGYLLGTAVQDSKTGEIVVVSGIMPTSLDPWCKSILWPDGLEFTDPGRSLTTTLRATQLDNRLLYVPLDADEYLLVENRQTDLNGDVSLYLDRDSTTNVILGPGLSSADPSDTVGDKEYDFLLPGQGVLVWHIDESVFCTIVGEVASEENIVCGPNANPDYGINSNPSRLGVALKEADGIKDLGDITSYYLYGSPFDPYFVGNHTVLGPNSNPSTATNDGGTSGVTIRVTTPSAVDMGIEVESEIRVDGWPILSAAGRGLGAPTSGSLLHDGRRSLVTAADSLILAWMSDGRPYVNGRESGEFMPLPAKIRGPVLFVDSLFRRNPSAPHGAGVVATCDDGLLYAVRPDSQNAGQAIPILGWPPLLGDPGVLATTPPVLTDDGNVLVGTNDGRVFAVTPSDSVTFAPLVTALCDTIVVGGSPLVSEASGNLAVGRFHGAGGYTMAYATLDGHLRIVDPAGKGVGAIDVVWAATPSAVPFRPHLLGLDLDRETGGDLELVVVDPGMGLVHAYDLTGAELPGWPVRTSGRPGAPAAGDLDGDGYPEVFALDDQGYLHRWNRNGVEPIGWPVSLTSRYDAGSIGGAGSPVIGDLDGDGRSDVLVALQDGRLVALDDRGRSLPGWPRGMGRSPDATPLLTSLNGSDFPPDPAGAAWLHVVAVDSGGLWDVSQSARADSALFTEDGVSARTSWIGLYGDRRRSSVLDDGLLAAPASRGALVAKGSFYCYPNPARGDEIGIAYTLDPGVSSLEIRVLDPAGTVVRTYQGTVAPAQNVEKIPLQGLASGVYLVRLEAKRGGASEVSFQKFAVVR
ncbi:MAG TPA: FG-GAP-like repeat-containing protein [Candidatus Eisenbacteria bacterium]|nr:FG-GAP-like repeat-containing protein [Candidatus Eisenbacteria bacterium]